MLATFDELGERPPGLAVRVRQPDPAGAWPRAPRRRPSSAACSWPAAWSRRVRCSTTRRPCASPRGSRGTPTTSRPACSAGSPSPGPRASGARAVRLDVCCRRTADALRSAGTGLTATARAALPPAVPHADAAFNAGRAALLVHALTSDPTLLLRGHRGPAAPGLSGRGDARHGVAGGGAAVGRGGGSGQRRRARPCWR